MGRLQACDVVIELIGGLQPAEAFIRTALCTGRAVVTANKALLAAKEKELYALAERSGASLRYSAAVGGALPALEAVERAPRGTIVRLRGVLNGTSNFMLEKMAGGDDFPAALTAARAAGLAEADPSLDLDGSDAAQKLALLIRSAGVSLDWQAISREGISAVAAEFIRAARAAGGAVRLVAEAEFSARGVIASVRPQWLAADDALRNCPGAWNALEIIDRDGRREIIRGCGAGRWPTTEAVLADLNDIRTALALETSSALEAAS